MRTVFTSLPTLETERLFLRPLTLGDEDDVFAYASDPEVARLVSWETHPDRNASRAFLEWVLNRYLSGREAPWAMATRVTGRVIGTCGFVHWDVPNGFAEIGYAMARKHWGKGIMTEAVRRVIDFGFQSMDLARIEAVCLMDNTASARVMEKVGMQFEGILRERLRHQGTPHDIKMYSILRHEWESDRTNTKGNI